MGILEVVFGVVGRLLWGPEAAAAAGSFLRPGGVLGPAFLLPDIGLLPVGVTPGPAFLRPGGVDGMIGQQGNCLLPDPDPEEGVIGQGMNKL